MTHNPSSCRLDDDGRCTTRGGGGGPHAGHGLFWVPASMTGRRPWGWRDAVVESVDGLYLRVAYVESGVTSRLWHHVSLEPWLEVGSPVRVHEEMGVLGCPVGWLSVSLAEGGLGPVLPPPETSRDLWPPDVVVTDLDAGAAWASDHVDADDEVYAAPLVTPENSPEDPPDEGRAHA